jgi:hypothetical protein
MDLGFREWAEPTGDAHMMMKYDRKADAPGPAATVLEYVKVRELSSKDDEANGATTHVIVIAASSFCMARFQNWPSPQDATAEDHPVDAPVLRTLEEFPERFGQLHSGFTITASKITVSDDKQRTVSLVDGRITDGIKSLTAIRRHFAKRGKLARDFSVRCTIIVDPKSGIHEWSRMTRNRRNSVGGLEIFGGTALQELATELERRNGAASIFGALEGEVPSVDRLLAIQVLTALMPDRFLCLSGMPISKSFALYQPMECIKLLMAATAAKADSQTAAAEYRFFVDMAHSAWLEYHRWKERSFWVSRLPGNLGKKVPDFIEDSIIFPILAAKSAFVVEKNGAWILDPPKMFSDEDLLIACSEGNSAFMRTTPLASETSYEALAMVTRMAKRYSEAKGR